MANGRPELVAPDPPRLVLRFAIWTAIGLSLAAAAILLVVRHFNTIQAERGATVQARVIASTVLRASLHASDFERPVSGPRRRAIDQLVVQHVLREGFLLVNLYSPTGTVTYSSDHRLVGTRPADPDHLREASEGTIRGDIASVQDQKTLRTYAPVVVRGGGGVVGLFHDYGPIASAAQATFIPVVGIFEAVLILLFIALMPILRRVSLRIRRQMEEIQRRAYFDELTGLPNRALFRDRVEQATLAAKRAGGSLAILLLDVDRFKEVNDTLGHDAGDVLLRKVSERLQPELRESETFARLGGDEFAVLLPGGSAEEATALGDRIHRALEEPFTLESFPVEVGTSIGVVGYPEHGEDADTLLQRADVAMYVAKDAGAAVAVYDPNQDANDAARLALAGELRKAIESAQLVLQYQPKAELRSGRIVGVEALVRWQHPERGFIPPDDFIPIAERTGLIKPLSRYVVGTALDQCQAWNRAGFDVHVSVNLTIPDLLDLELPDRIGALLEKTGVRPDQLELEITESTILADPFRVRQVLNRLNEMGLRLAIDDFGTGYSSLALLKRLPVQTVKIDRSFVSDMCEDASDATIVRSTIDLGRNLGLDVVAEGVETEAVWNALRDLGCTLAQGYLIGKPMPADELLELLGRSGGAAAVAR